MITLDGNKMSKSKGNVVDPDDYDPDELRNYLMFIGPYFDGGDWDDSKIKGIIKFHNRLRRWFGSASDEGEDIELGGFINTIDRGVETFKFNLVISGFMKFYNTHKNKTISSSTKDELMRIFHCFSPGFEI